MLQRRTRTAATKSLLSGALIASAAVVFSPTAALAAPPPVTVSFTPGAEQTFVVPAGVTALQVVASGGRGGANASTNGLGGYGASVTATIGVTPGQTLYVAVGANGGSGPGGPSGTTTSGGTAGNQHNTGGGGGGASVVSTCSGADANCTTSYYGGTEPRLLVAAGGGGGGGYDGCNGGNGAGGVTGRGGTGSCGGGGSGGAGVGGEGNFLVSCAPPQNRGGKGGTLVGPGAGGLSSTGNVGRPGVGTQGGTGYLTTVGDGFGGGGGGGYYGGGGGGATNACGAYGFGGGAGSSYAVASATSFALSDDTTATPRITITYAAPLPSTIASQASAPIALGAGSISDTATVTITSGVPPTGTVTFDVFGPDDVNCSGPPADSSTTSITAGDAASTPFIPTAVGVYRFVASYGGDADNAPSSGACNDANEATTVSPAPSGITTQASAPIALGAGSISDTATVTITSGVPPTGTVTFDVFGPDDAMCSAPPASSSTNPITAGDAASTPFTPTAGGVYRFVASYSGDASNLPSSGACNDPNESTTVDPATSGMTTQASVPITLGAGSISDSATVGIASGVPPTGTVTFDVFGPDDATCSAPPAFESTNPIIAGDAASTPFTPTASGVYRFVTTYSGDSNNASVSGACNDANQSTMVSAQALPAVSPSAPSPTLSISPSPSSPPSRDALRLTTDTTDITPGQAGRLHVTGTTGQAVQLLCYSRPSTTYVQARPAQPGQGIVISNGALDFSILPGRNTRCFVQYLNDASTQSNSTVINVHTVLSLSVHRDGVQGYHFQGTNLPRLGGQLITLYRLDSNGNEIRTATTRTGTSGTWHIDRVFNGSGPFRFVARTSQTLNNGAGKSNVLQVTVH
jgi:hypothetical protein